MRFDILTLFPGMFEGPFRESMLKRASDRGLIEINLHNIRDYATDRHRTTDDYPFGGGTGMVMKPDPIFAALESVMAQRGVVPPPDWPGDRVYAPPLSAIVLMTPQGRRLEQRVAQELATLEHIVLVCGRYEGVDERIRSYAVTDEISIGDYVLTGGELPAMVLVDCVSRLVPGVLPTDAPVEESHSEGLLEYPQYTRPADFRGHQVPEMLISGHHENVRKWRRCQSLWRTHLRRPDLLAKMELDKEDLTMLRRIKNAIAEGRSPCE
ncbi:MAG: tRNA (guanosine(37)-N1)-methyltransferase TrmD [Chloroflexota bacterium]